MTPEQIRHAILQRLESLQRAGVAQLPRVALTAVAPLPDAARSDGTVSPAPARPPLHLPTEPHAGSGQRERPGTESGNRSQVAPPAANPPSPAPRSSSPPATSPMPRPVNKPSLQPAADSASPPAQKLTPEERRVALEVIHSEVRGCTRCSQLVANRTQTVFGVGSVTPRLCFFGEAPGGDEDKQGEPFVGRAGQLLNKIIDAMGLKREEVYILNVLKCRPPDNRPPADDEIENCRRFFERQLDVLKPEFICCLGASAAKTLLHSAFSLGKMRGRFYDIRGAQVVVTYHPAYLLRNPAAKKDTWEDIQMLMKAMGIVAKAPD